MLPTERELLIDNLLVRIHFIILMIRWTGLAPWAFESSFPGSLTSTFLQQATVLALIADQGGGAHWDLETHTKDRDWRDL